MRLLQFKPNYLSQSEATKTDFIRTAKSLICSPELDGDILTFPKLPYFGTRNQHQILNEGKIVLITATAQGLWMKITKIIEKLGLELAPTNQEVEMSPGILETALRFALEAKLAPNWNRVADYFVHTPDFLNLTFFEVIHFVMCFSYPWRASLSCPKFQT